MTPQTQLLRQINPNWIQGERVTSQAFRPTTKDEGLLSVYDGDLITAEGAWVHSTGQLHLVSAGVQAVTVEECVALALSARSDPAQFPEHAVIDFNNLPRVTIERNAKTLRNKAEARGWLYKQDPTG